MVIRRGSHWKASIADDILICKILIIAVFYVLKRKEIEHLKSSWNNDAVDNKK